MTNEYIYMWSAQGFLGRSHGNWILTSRSQHGIRRSSTMWNPHPCEKEPDLQENPYPGKGSLKFELKLNKIWFSN